MNVRNKYQRLDLNNSLTLHLATILLMIMKKTLNQPEIKFYKGEEKDKLNKASLM